MKIRFLSFFLFSLLWSLDSVQGAGGGGTTGESTTPAPTPDPTEGCIRADLNSLFSGFCGCDGPTDYSFGVQNAQGLCPDGDVKICLDVTGSGVDTFFPGTCTDMSTAQPFFPFLTVDLNDLAAGFEFPLSSPITDCANDDQDENLFNYVFTTYPDLCITPGFLHVCPADAQCPNDFDRNGGRRLEENSDSFEKVFQVCGDYEYEGFLHVTDHLYALAVPGPQAKAIGCPYVSSHAIIGDNQDPESTHAVKEIKIWRNQGVFEEMFSPQDSMSFGTFHLANELLPAYSNAKVSNSDAVAVYDVIKNNCGHFIVNLANQLGVDIDAKVTSFVASRLLKHAGADLITKMRGSVFFPSLFESNKNRLLRANKDDSNIADEELLGALVEETVSSGLLAN